MNETMNRRVCAALLGCAVLVGANTAAAPAPKAEPAPAAAASAAEASPQQAAWAAAAQAMKKGPQSIALRDQAKLALPEGFAFVPLPQAATVMEAMGNSTDSRFLGLVLPLDENANWLISVEYEDAGYIKDDDAKHWKSDELLDNLKTGTEAGNERRTRLGMPGLEVTRWVEPPTYDAATHRLVWSAEAKEKGAPAGADPTINYNTYVLGREGFVSLNLITTASTVESEKPVAQQLLAATEFDSGKRYTDFNASTDKIAAYGLAALIGGVAVKKLGLLAVIGVFFAKFFKIILIGLAAAGGTFAKIFKRKSS